MKPYRNKPSLAAIDLVSARSKPHNNNSGSHHCHKILLSPAPANVYKKERQTERKQQSIHIVADGGNLIRSRCALRNSRSPSTTTTTTTYHPACLLQLSLSTVPCELCFLPAGSLCYCIVFQLSIAFETFTHGLGRRGRLPVGRYVAALSACRGRPPGRCIV